MESVSMVLGFAIALLYITVSCCYIIRFRSADDKSRNYVRIFAGITVLAHLCYLVFVVLRLGRLPMASAYEALSVTAFFIAATYILIQFTSGESGTGILVFPVATALQLISALKMYKVESFDPILASPYFAVHTLPSIMGYAAFLISMLYSCMYLLMHAQIRSRKFGLVFANLPSLDALDRLNSKAISTGFVMLTIGILTGMIWAEQAWKDASLLDPKILISYLIWMLYGTSIFLRIFRGWQGKRVASLSILGGVILLFSFIFVSNFVSSIHTFL